MWYALAEFVDNSTQSYFNNQELMDKEFKDEGDCLRVDIQAGKDEKGGFLRITDNSVGMSRDELKNAVHIGKPPVITGGRSKYGLGLKTGAHWFGDLWTIESEKLGENKRHKITVNVSEVASGNLDLPEESWEAAREEHDTIIEIRDLHRTIPSSPLK